MALSWTSQTPKVTLLGFQARGDQAFPTEFGTHIDENAIMTQSKLQNLQLMTCDFNFFPLTARCTFGTKTTRTAKKPVFHSQKSSRRPRPALLCPKRSKTILILFIAHWAQEKLHGHDGMFELAFRPFPRKESRGWETKPKSSPIF